MKLARSLTTLSLALALPFALAACAPGDEVADDTLDDTGAPAATPAPETPPPATTDMAEMQAAFTPLGESMLSGDVRIDDESDGQATSVEVTINGSTAGAVHQGMIHSGTCDAPGGVVAQLDPITVGDDGTGTATTTASVATMTVADGAHTVIYHEANGSPGAPVVCAAVPMHTM
jgi:hypothetical protein